MDGSEGSDPSNTPLMVRNFEKYILPMLIRRMQRKLLEEDKRSAAEAELGVIGKRLTTESAEQTETRVC